MFPPYGVFHRAFRSPLLQYSTIFAFNNMQASARTGEHC
jgi:hypothetical protein